jgi:hypothetical protein
VCGAPTPLPRSETQLGLGAVLMRMFFPIAAAAARLPPQSARGSEARQPTREWGWGEGEGEGE